MCKIGIKMTTDFCQATGKSEIDQESFNFKHQHRRIIWKRQANNFLWPENRNAWIYSGKFQGDIAGVNPRYANMVSVSRNAVKDKSLRWPGGIIPYVLDSTYSKFKATGEIAFITKAFNVYNTKTCIRFVARTSEVDYLHIYKDLGCYSMVGRAGGKQDLSLGRGCMFHEIIVHELMHALGFWHEHSRADRDTFVRVRWENVAKGMESQFSTVGHAFADYLGETYDYRSVLHYDRRAFSKNGLNTIEALQYDMTDVLGRGLDLSEGDLRKINRLYECNGIAGNVVVPHGLPGQPSASTRSRIPDCIDKFADCQMFKRYCFRENFNYVMKLYCSETCGLCIVQHG